MTLDMKPGLKFTSITSGFKQITVKVIENYFPQVEICGCLFHNMTNNFRSETYKLN